MKMLRDVKVQREAAIEFFKQNVATYITKTGPQVNKKMWEESVGIYDNYNSIGDNAYRVYNVLTHLSTHIEAKRDGTDTERKRIRYEQDMDAVIKGAAFRSLAKLDELAFA